MSHTAPDVWNPYASWDDPETLGRLWVDPDAGFLDTLTKAITGSAGARFELVVGPPGSGKTHLLALLAHRARRKLGSKAIVLALGSADGFGSVADLLAAAVLMLPLVEVERLDAFSTLQGLLLEGPGAAVANGRHADALQRAREIVHVARGLRQADAISSLAAALRDRAGRRPLLIFVESLERFFETVGAEGQHALRALLQNEGRWSLVGTALRVTDAFVHQQSPFYASFALRTLPKLSAPACGKLLARRATDDPKLARVLESPDGRVAIRTVHHLLGGTPRAYVDLGPLLSEATLRQCVPLVAHAAAQARREVDAVIRSLSSGQRIVFERVLAAPRPLTGTELVDSLFGSTHQTIATHLLTLRHGGLVHCLSVGRFNYYEPAQPLHRLAQLGLGPRVRLDDVVEKVRAWRRVVGNKPGISWARATRTIGGNPRLEHALRCLEGADAASILPAALTASGSQDRAHLALRHSYARTPAPLREVVRQVLTAAGYAQTAALPAPSAS